MNHLALEGTLSISKLNKLVYSSTHYLLIMKFWTWKIIRTIAQNFNTTDLTYKNICIN